MTGGGWFYVTERNVDPALDHQVSVRASIRTGAVSACAVTGVPAAPDAGT